MSVEALRCKVCPDGAEHFNHSLRQEVATRMRRFPNAEAPQWIGPESVLRAVEDHLEFEEK